MDGENQRERSGDIKSKRNRYFKAGFKHLDKENRNQSFIKSG
tara:strand:- start:226 stop:351 length:126 start_codon:yes stop_codon:yes gene_type:complete